MAIWYTSKMEDLYFYKKLISSYKKLKEIKIQLIGFFTHEKIRKLIEILYSDLYVIEIHGTSSYGMKDEFVLLFNDFKLKNIKYYFYNIFY